MRARASTMVSPRSSASRVHSRSAACTSAPAPRMKADICRLTVACASSERSAARRARSRASIAVATAATASPRIRCTTAAALSASNSPRTVSRLCAWRRACSARLSAARGSPQRASVIARAEASAIDASSASASEAGTACETSSRATNSRKTTTRRAGRVERRAILGRPQCLRYWLICMSEEAPAGVHPRALQSGAGAMRVRLRRGQ